MAAPIAGSFAGRSKTLIGTDLAFLGIKTEAVDLNNRLSCELSAGRFVLQSKPDSFRIKRISSGLLSLGLSCGIVGGVFVLGGFGGAEIWREGLIWFGAALGLTGGAFRRVISRATVQDEMIGFRGHSILGGFGKRVSWYKLSESKIHGETRFGIILKFPGFFGIPSYWYLLNRRFLEDGRGKEALVGVLGELKADSLESSSASPLVLKSPLKVWEDIWSEGSDLPEKLKIISTVNPKISKILKTVNINKAGILASADDESKVIGFLKSFQTPDFVEKSVHEQRKPKLA